MQDNKLARFEPTSFEELMNLAKWLSGSQLLPSQLRGKTHDIAIILMHGYELGLSTMQAISSIDVVSGKPVASAQLAVALCVREKEICEYFRLVESTPEKATWATKRKGMPEEVKLTYTIEEARLAGLLSKENYRKHPGPMLRARGAKSLATAVYPDLMRGMIDTYEAEEVKEREIRLVPGAFESRPLPSKAGNHQERLEKEYLHPKKTPLQIAIERRRLAKVPEEPIPAIEDAIPWPLEATEQAFDPQTGELPLEDGEEINGQK